jgi:hypothetical protein
MEKVLTVNSTALTTTTSLDAQILGVLSARVKEIIDGGGQDLMAALLAARFPAGVHLSDTDFSTDPAASEPAWQAVGSWNEIAVAALRAGKGGFALVHLADPRQGAIGIHVANNDSLASVLWILRLRSGTDLTYRRFDQTNAADLPAPANIAVIDYCGIVQLPAQALSDGPGPHPCG